MLLKEYIISGTMSIYELTKLAQQFEKAQDYKSADLALSTAHGLDMHLKNTERGIKKLLKLARDFTPVTNLPQGNAPNYPTNVKSKIPDMVAAMNALAELHLEVGESTITGQGPLAPLFKDAYQTLLEDMKALNKSTWENQTGVDIYNTPVYRAGYPHTPGSTSTTNMGAQFAAGLMAKSKSKFVKISQPGQSYVSQTMDDWRRNLGGAGQTVNNLMNPGAIGNPGEQKYIGEAGTISPQTIVPYVRPPGQGRSPLITKGLGTGFHPNEHFVDPKTQLYWNLGQYSQLAPEAVAAHTAVDPENLAYSKLMPTLLMPLFNRFKELYVAHGGTLPKNDKELNDIFLVGAQRRSGLSLNEIAKRGIQWITNALFRPQLTAAEGAGNAIGQGAGIAGNLAGTMFNRYGPPLSGMTPAVTNSPY